MPTFEYKAVDSRKKLFTDIISATSESEAQNLLKDKGLKILVLKKVKEKGFSLPFGKIKGGFSTVEKINFCRYFSVLLNAGLPIDDSLELLIRSTVNPTVKEFLQDIVFCLRSGKSLSESLSRYPQFFNDVFLAMVKTGEISGTLEQSFDSLAKQLKQEEDLRRRVTGALIYPIIIICLMLAVTVLMMTFVLPRLGKVFLTMNMKLPLVTSLLLKASLLLEKRILLFGGSFLILGLIMFTFLKSKKGKKFLFSLLEWLPVSKKVLFYYNLARFNRNLSVLLKCGVSIGQSLDIAIDSLVISQKEKLRKQFSEKIVKGVPLSTIFEETKFFPLLMIGMIAVGEKSGNLDKTCVEVATFYQEEVENSLKNLIALLEPILIIIVGIGVAVMILSFIAPIYSLISRLSPS